MIMIAVHMSTQSLVSLQWDNLISFIKQSLIIIMMWSYQYDDVLIIIFDDFLMTNDPLGSASGATQLWNNHILSYDMIISSHVAKCQAKTKICAELRPQTSLHFVPHIKIILHIWESLFVHAGSGSISYAVTVLRSCTAGNGRTQYRPMRQKYRTTEDPY